MSLKEKEAINIPEHRLFMTMQLQYYSPHFERFSRVQWAQKFWPTPGSTAALGSFGLSLTSSTDFVERRADGILASGFVPRGTSNPSLFLQKIWSRLIFTNSVLMAHCFEPFKAEHHKMYPTWQQSLLAGPRVSPPKAGAKGIWWHAKSNARIWESEMHIFEAYDGGQKLHIARQAMQELKTALVMEWWETLVLQQMEKRVVRVKIVKDPFGAVYFTFLFPVSNFFQSCMPLESICYTSSWSQAF